MPYYYDSSDDEDGTAVIYTDGACSGNGQDNARAGIGVYWESPKRPDWNISERLDGRQTNQRAEIKAVIRGIEKARSQGFSSVLVKLDSHYVKNAAESWMPNWERNGWRGNVANKDLFIELSEAMDEIDTSFEYVPSRSNRADPLARQGAAMDQYGY